jgi:hypothetical protein
MSWPSPAVLIGLSSIFAIAAAIAAGVASWRTSVEQDRQISIIEAWSTGADSYPYFVPLLRSDRLAFFIQHSGRYPAFDVYVRVQDGLGNLLQGPVHFGALSSGSGVDWLTLPPSLVLPPRPGPGPVRIERRIEIQTRNEKS